MCSTRGSRALPREGCPIQKSPDQRSLPTPRCLSQAAASFFGSWCLGIHLGPLLACSTYNHSSVAEAMIFGHVNMSNRQIRKRIQILLVTAFCRSRYTYSGVTVLLELGGLEP